MNIYLTQLLGKFLILNHKVHALLLSVEACTYCLYSEWRARYILYQRVRNFIVNVVLILFHPEVFHFALMQDEFQLSVNCCKLKLLDL